MAETVTGSKVAVEITGLAHSVIHQVVGIDTFGGHREFFQIDTVDGNKQTAAG